MGATWATIPSGIVAKCIAVRGSGKKDVWILFEPATLIHYDGVAIKRHGLSGASLHALWSFGPGEAWVGGETGAGSSMNAVVYRWNGSDWKLESAPDATVLDGFWGSADSLWATAGDVVYRRAR